MSAVINCPHCRGAIQNDPAIAGQVVTCPHCRQQFQVPPVAVAVQESAFPSFNVNAPTSASSSRAYKKKQDTTLATLAKIGLPILGIMILCCGGLRGLMQVSDQGGGSAFSTELSKKDFVGVIGKSKEEVIEQVGRPSNTFDWEGGEQQWVYLFLYDPITDDDTATVRLTFQGDVCVGMD